jgi:hypothetical protein
MRDVQLEDAGIAPRVGFDAWRRDGTFAFRSLRQGAVFSRRAAYFRVNATGSVYAVISRFKTIQVRPRFCAIAQDGGRSDDR